MFFEKRRVLENRHGYRSLSSEYYFSEIFKLNVVDGRTGSEQTKQERGWYDAGYCKQFLVLPIIRAVEHA